MPAIPPCIKSMVVSSPCFPQVKLRLRSASETVDCASANKRYPSLIIQSRHQKEFCSIAFHRVAALKINKVSRGCSADHLDEMSNKSTLMAV